MTMLRNACVLTAFLLAPCLPAFADPGQGEGRVPVSVVRTATLVPEPSAIGLFLIGVAGLIIGRRTARSKRRGGDREA
jgi:hypothetical protein